MEREANRSEDEREREETRTDDRGSGGKQGLGVVEEEEAEMREVRKKKYNKKQLQCENN